jgi:hypothetical protein
MWLIKILIMQINIINLLADSIDCAKNCNYNRKAKKALKTKKKH